jgi:plastocyanin
MSNRGRFDHGFRIREEREGGKGGDRFEARTGMLRPGQTARLTLDLAEGLYEIECYVEGHDARGMKGLLEVRADAPFVEPSKPAPKTVVTIQGFAFKPAKLTINAGQTARWVNKDAAPHTVTAKSGAWTSKQLGRGGTFSRKLTRPGTYPYICAIHPQMRGTLVVRR